VAGLSKRRRQLTIHPPENEELAEAYRNGVGSFSPDQAIDARIKELEAWAEHNRVREKQELWRFWSLRGLSFLGASGAAASAAMGVPLASIVLGSIAALAVAVDAAWPVSSDRATRRRAIHDLRELEHTLKIKWDKVRLAYPQEHAVKRVANALALLDAAQSKREEIGKYLGEASPSVESPSPRF
jgi:hypothetical protein